MVSPNNRTRLLLDAKRRKMARSVQAYVRGTTRKFYDWLNSYPADLPIGPSVWICGDCHVGNLGPIADTKGRVQIDIRDFDQTVIGNPAHDIIRLGLSLATAARTADLSGVVTAEMLDTLLDGYEAGLAADPLLKRLQSHKPRRIQRLLMRSVRRRWRQLAVDRLNVLGRPKLKGRHFWPVTKQERQAIEELVLSAHAQRIITATTHQRDLRRVDVRDVAYWIKGCSSLGRLRYAVLVGVGKRRRRRFALLDIKEAVAPAAPRDDKARMPAGNAERVVTGARALSPELGDRMILAKLLGREVFVRELAPQDLKIEIPDLHEGEAAQLARYLGSVLGFAHGRQMQSAERKDWLAQLRSSRSESEKPRHWLWNSVVELIAIHEAEYLTFCGDQRRGRAHAGSNVVALAAE
jgi:uncharacterized protein (DUF2252 family)